MRITTASTRSGNSAALYCQPLMRNIKGEGFAIKRLKDGFATAQYAEKYVLRRLPHDKLIEVYNKSILK